MRDAGRYAVLDGHGLLLSDQDLEAALPVPAKDGYPGDPGTISPGLGSAAGNHCRRGATHRQTPGPEAAPRQRPAALDGKQPWRPERACPAFPPSSTPTNGSAAAMALNPCWCDAELFGHWWFEALGGAVPSGTQRRHELHQSARVLKAQPNLQLCIPVPPAGAAPTTGSTKPMPGSFLNGAGPVAPCTASAAKRCCIRRENCCWHRTGAGTTNELAKERIERHLGVSG